MSRIRKTMGLDRMGIESLSLPEKDKQFLRQLIAQLELMHRNMRETAESIGKSFGQVTIDFEPTANWRIKEVGDNLEFQKKVDGTYTKKAAVTG